MTQITDLDVAGTGMSTQHAKAAIDKINSAIGRIDEIYPSTGGELTPADGFAGTGPGVPRVLAGAFVLADIEAGTKVFTTLPAGAIVTGASVKITTALAFADGGVGDTTEVTLKAGTSGDDDAWLAVTALAGAVGYKYPAIAGAGIGMATAGGSGKFTLTFAASAGLSPDLADVSAGAGTVYLIYCMPA